MVVGFTITCAINDYHHQRCVFTPCSWRGVLDTILCDKVCQWYATGRRFTPGSPVTTINKTDRHDIAQILTKAALNTINQREKKTKKTTKYLLSHAYKKLLMTFCYQINYTIYDQTKPYIKQKQFSDLNHYPINY